MTYLTVAFLDFIFLVLPVWLPLLAVDLVALYLLLFKERYDPRTFVFWVAIVVVLPFAGFLLYLVFGCTLFSRRTYGRKHDEDSWFFQGEGDVPPAGIGDTASMFRRSGADVYTSGNDVRTYWSLREVRSDLTGDIMAAESRIWMMMPVLPRGEGSAALVDALASRAKDGLDVRVMTSSRGFGRTSGLRALREAGAVYASFHRTLRAVLTVKPANRNKRVIIVIDGRVAYLGSDAPARIVGPAAARAECRFMADWHQATGESLSVPEAVRSEAGAVGVQMVSGGPDLGDLQPLMMCQSAIIAGSRQRLYLTFPYLCPADDLLNSIKLAVLSGADTRIIIPCQGVRWYQLWNSLSASNPLMMAGARVYFSDSMRPRSVIVSDGRICYVGTGSYTSRSLYNDFNTGAVLFSEEAASREEAAFEEELRRAVECLPEEYKRRSLADMARITLARMLQFLV